MPAGVRPNPPDGSVRVAIRGKIYAQTWVNVVWLQLTHTGAPSFADFFTLSGRIAGHWATRFKPVQRADVAYTDWRTEWYLGAGNLSAAGSLSGVGALTGNSISDASASMIVNWLIQAAYRGGHPRNYLPGLADSEVSQGSYMTSAKATAVGTAAAAFMADCLAETEGSITGCQLGTVSFVHDKAWRTPPIFRPYLAASVQPFIGTQRRRIRN